MGKLIDIDKARKEYSNLMDLTMNDRTLLLTLYGVLDNAPTVEAIPKDQYDARLKADIEAAFKSLQLEIEELDFKDPYTDQNYQTGAEETRQYILNMIEEKIDKPEEDEQ